MFFLPKMYIYTVMNTSYTYKNTGYAQDLLKIALVRPKDTLSINEKDYYTNGITKEESIQKLIRHHIFLAMKEAEVYAPLFSDEMEPLKIAMQELTKQANNYKYTGKSFGAYVKTCIKNKLKKECDQEMKYANVEKTPDIDDYLKTTGFALDESSYIDFANTDRYLRWEHALSALRFLKSDMKYTAFEVEFFTYCIMPIFLDDQWNVQDAMEHFSRSTGTSLKTCQRTRSKLRDFIMYIIRG